MQNDLINYYKDRAAEYEKIYFKPERQEDLKKATAILRSLFLDLEILEIACGTGYWTEKISASAKAITATDVNQEVLDIAKTKEYACPVTLECHDLYDLKATNNDNLFAAFIWSHVLLQDLDAFITKINGLVKTGSLVVVMDNKYVEGSSTPLAETDEKGNTFQHRGLADGSIHKVLKNFPTEDFLRKIMEKKCKDFKFQVLDYFWILTYRTL